MVGVAAAIAIPLTLYLAPPAGASHAGAVKSKNESIGYTHVLTFRSRPLHRCVTIVLGGFIQYKFSASANSSSWTDQKLAKPIMVAGVHKLRQVRRDGQAHRLPAGSVLGRRQVRIQSRDDRSQALEAFYRYLAHLRF